MAFIKKDKITEVGKYIFKKRKPLYTASRNVKWYNSHYGKY